MHVSASGPMGGKQETMERRWVLLFCVPRWAGKKLFSLLMMYNKSNKCTHFKTEMKRERKTQSHGRYKHTEGCRANEVAFGLRLEKLKNISVEYNNFIVH